MSRQDFYRYLQISDYFRKEVKDLNQKELSNVVQLFVDAYNCRSSKGLISKLYRAVTSKGFHRVCEATLGKRTGHCNNRGHVDELSTTNSFVWRDFCWKNLICFFRTPNQKGKQTDTQLGCWKECGENMVDHAHVFWLCPPIQTYWREVTEVIDKVSGFIMDATFIYLYLGHFHGGLTKDDEYLLKILLAAEKKAITKHWPQKDTPTVGTFVGIVEHLHLLEQMTYSIWLQKEIVEKRWGEEVKLQRGTLFFADC